MDFNVVQILLVALFAFIAGIDQFNFLESLYQPIVSGAVIGAILATLPDAVLGGCTIMMFGNIVISGMQMLGKCGYSQRNITIVALSLSVGLGFTQVPEIFNILPQIVKTVFAENCVAVVFIMAIVLNLILPKNMEVDR